MTEHAARDAAHHVSDLTENTEQRSTAELVDDMSRQVSRLVRDEIKLGQYELMAKGKRLGLGAGIAGAAGVLAWFGAGALLLALILGVATALPAWLSAVLVGLGLLVVASLLGLVSRVVVKRATPPTPEEATDSVKEDIETIKGRAQS